MPKQISTAQGIHPYFLGTDTPVDVDAPSKWSITYQGNKAVLVYTLGSGQTLEFKLPQSGGSKSGNKATFTIPNFGTGRWVTHNEHVKFEVTFPVAPKTLTVSLDVAKQGVELTPGVDGALDVMAAGVKVGSLPRPWIEYNPGGTGDRVRTWLDWSSTPTTLAITLPSLTAAEWPTAVLDPTVITTSTASAATAYSNQRKIDRCQNGVVWTMFWDGTSTTTTSMDFYYSTDSGATWAKGGEFGFAGTGTTYVPNGSMFIDLDDYAHVVYKDRHDGFIYYRRGTPNAGRTAWTWSASTAIWSATTGDYPDIVAHREGSDWRAHVIFSRHDATTSDTVYAARVDITSAGGVSVGTTATVRGAASYGNTVAKFPSIDFNHTGDGKTVAGSTPHLYAAWSAGATGAGTGVRFKKATYSGGTWTWGTEREIDSTRYVWTSQYWLNCLFDGTRVVIGGQLLDADGYADLVLHDRDAADTTTTSRVLVDNSASGNVGVSLYTGSISYDSAGDVYLVGSRGSGLRYRKWTRATGILASESTVDASGVSDDGFTSAKRGYVGGKIEFVYTDGTVSPFSVTYGSISLGITVAINPATETDTAQPLTRKKTRAILPASEADAAQALGRVKRVGINPALETDTSMPVSTGIRVTINPALEVDAAQALTVTLTPHPYTFTPPVVSERIRTNVKPFMFYTMPQGMAVVWRNGHFVTVRTPSQEETAALVEGTTWFSGGRTYTVSGSTVGLLTTDGYTVTPV